jgi:spore coat polysaccharide biosynthesis predicted glycosyltransferase SpsG
MAGQIMKVFFLTEYSSEIGYGHISRCSALAETFKQKNYGVTFLIRGCDQDNLQINYNYELVEWNSLLNLDLIPMESLIIFDSYKVTSTNLDLIASKFKYIVSITDSKLNYANKGIIIIASSYGENIELNKNESIIEVLKGPKYMLFRKDFWNIENPILKPTIKTITISLGSFVKEDDLNKVIRLIAENFKDCKIQILGKGESGNIKENKVEYLNFLNSEKLVSILMGSDLLISNGGQSLNEVILIGVPVISIEMVNNQHLNVKYWSRLGVLKNELSINSSFFFNDFQTSIDNIKKYPYRVNNVKKGLQILDSKGAERIYNKITEAYAFEIN